MSLWALPSWVYEMEYEEKEAMILGAFKEELDSGFVRSTPEHIADLIRRKHVYDIEFDADGKCVILEK